MLNKFRGALAITGLLFGTTSLACGGDAASGDPGATQDDAVTAGWTTIGYGVAYQKVGGGDSVFIAYGGYTAQQNWSCAWAMEMWKAKLQAMGVGHLYAVQGPRDASYSGDEIGNSKLKAHLEAGIGKSASFILVAAHSSGAFVAHELLRQLNSAGDDDILKKTVYANLDAGGSGFNSTVASKLRRVAFVYARDPAVGYSHNSDAAISLGQEYSEYGASMKLTITGSGCHQGARWCLHDLLVTHRPHNPDMFDLRDDYTDFQGRAPTVEYVDNLAQYLGSGGANDTESPPTPPPADDSASSDDATDN